MQTIPLWYFRCFFSSGVLSQNTGTRLLLSQHGERCAGGARGAKRAAPLCSQIIFLINLGAFDESGLWSRVRVLDCLQPSRSMACTLRLDSDG